jgi:hypothetical protein
LVRSGVSLATYVDEGDPVRVGSQKLGLAVTMLAIPYHSDVFSRRFEGVANGANSQQATQDSFLRTGKLR